MSKTNFLNFGMSFLIFILILLSPRKDLATLLTLLLGSFVAALSIALYILKYEYKMIQNLNSVYLSISFLLGVILEIIGMFVGDFLATFHLEFVPFSFYLALSLMITLQLNYGINLYFSISKSEDNQKQTTST